MIEAMLLGGTLGPAEPWQYIGYTLAGSGSDMILEGGLPNGVQPGDLLVGMVSGRNYGGVVGQLQMTAEGWLYWSNGSGDSRTDWVCAARYTEGLALPRWEQPYSRYVRICVMAFRAPGWSSISLEHQNAPMQYASVTTRARNTLLINIGVTPETTRNWYANIGSELEYQRVDIEGGPGLYVSEANVAEPKTVDDIYVNASSGAERNLILSAY